MVTTKETDQATALPPATNEILPGDLPVNAPARRAGRRTLLTQAAKALGLGAIGWGARERLLGVALAQGAGGPVKSPKIVESVKITRLETFLVQPRWLFLKVHTNVGVVGLGEPVVEGRTLTVQTAVKELEPYLIGKDPRNITHHWQAIYRHAFYRGGPILTSALSGVDQALWDIKGKLLGVPVYDLLGGPTRRRIRVYSNIHSVAELMAAKARGFTAFKCNPAKQHPTRIIENKAAIDFMLNDFMALRQAAGPDCDLAIDFHGAVPPPTAKLMIKALEPYQPMFIEEPINCQYTDLMAEIARGTHLPIATGERIFTKWGFREILEKHAATILQPDLCHAGGISEGRNIAGMAEAFYATVAPHNPLGPISLASGLQLDAAIPNFLCQEQSSLGDGYLKTPFTVKNGYVDLPTGPGLGIELDEVALAKKIGHDYKNKDMFDADDGSVVDW